MGDLESVYDTTDISPLEGCAFATFLFDLDGAMNSSVAVSERRDALT